MPEIKIVQPQSLQKTFPEAKFLYNTSEGKIYALPFDNMPCLVAINSDPMIVKMDLKELKKIPNAIPEQRIIPEYRAPENFIPNIYK
jgi:hypothetical protein